MRILLSARHELTVTRTRQINRLRALLLTGNDRDRGLARGTLTDALLDKFGIGPVSSAQAIVSWSHPGRCRNEAAFAALAGASPIPASSGRTVRHRHNRGGDRALNRALHDIMLTRWRACPKTRAYIAKRRAQGKNDGEIRRSIKRYIARELFRTLEVTVTT